MPRPVCVACQTEMYPKTNGVGVMEHMGNGLPYKLWDADLWQCRKCGTQIVCGYGERAIAQHFEPHFDNVAAGYKATTGLVLVDPPPTKQQEVEQQA